MDRCWRCSAEVAQVTTTTPEPTKPPLFTPEEVAAIRREVELLSYAHLGLVVRELLHEHTELPAPMKEPRHYAN